MANLDLITFEDLYLNLLRRVKGDPNDSESLDKTKEILNTRYRQICNRKKWKFLRTDRAIQIPIPYTTGTMTFPTQSRLVTGIGTSWNSSMIGSWFLPTGSNISYRVVGVFSTTSLMVNTVNSENTFTAAPYTLYKAELGLFPNLEDIDDVRIDGKRWPVEPVGPGEINRLRQQFPTAKGRPLRYSKEGKFAYSGPVMGQFLMGYDFMGTTLQQGISYYPAIPDQNYTLTVYYKLKVNAMVLPTDQPLIPVEYRTVLFYYGLSDWYASNDSAMSAYYQKLGDAEFNEMMTKYVDTDDVLRFKTRSTLYSSKSYLLRHSSTYFDTEG